MTKTVEAIFSNGVLKPVLPLQGIAENERVRVTIIAPEAQLPFAGWTGDLPDAEATEMLRVIEEEFEKVNSDEWK